MDVGMFGWISRVVIKFWPAVLVFWLLALGLAISTRPEWSSVAIKGELEHLPPNSPTRVGGELYSAAFPDDITDSSIVIVLHRSQSLITQADERFILRSLVPGLRNIADELGGMLRGQDTISRLYQQLRERLAPLDLPFDRGLELLLDVVENRRLDTALGSDAEGQIAPEADQVQDRDSIDRAQREASVVQGADEVERAQQPNMDRPEVVSIISVGDFLLGPMLRSADGQATLVAMNLTSDFLDAENILLANSVRQLIVELQESGEVPEGLSISLTGSTLIGADTNLGITESTRAVRQWTTWLIIALLLLVFRAPVSAVLPLATLYVAVEVTIALLAWGAYFEVIEVFDGLMLYVSVIVYGAGVDYSLFLVSRHREEMVGGATVKQAASLAITSTGIAVAASAGTEIVGIGLLGFAEFGKFQQAGIGIALGLFVLLLASLTLTPALLCWTGRLAFWPSTMQKKAEDRKRLAEAEAEDSVSRLWRNIGRVQQKYPCRVWLGTLLLLTPLAIFGAFHVDNQTYDLTSSLPKNAPSVEGLRVLSEHFSEGATGPITLLIHDSDTNFSSLKAAEGIAKLTERLIEVAPELNIASISSMVDPLGTSQRAEQIIGTLAVLLPQLSFLQQGELVASNPAELNEAERILQSWVREVTYEVFVSSVPPYANHVTWLSITQATDPYATDSIEHLDLLEERIHQVRPAELEHADFYLLGATASLRDVRDVARRDFRQTFLLIPTGVLLILILIIRKLIIPVYLIATVLMSFFVTIGVTTGVFWLLNPSEFAGLQWTVPVLLFVVLVAVGEDYSVLLVSRTDEEQQEHGPTEGITEALVKTGGLISGAGIIMSGTFSALAVGGTLTGMHQLGFALAFGVLLDTFVVRPLLVPSFQQLLVRWFKHGAKSD